MQVHYDLSLVLVLPLFLQFFDDLRLAYILCTQNLFLILELPDRRPKTFDRPFEILDLRVSLDVVVPILLQEGVISVGYKGLLDSAGQVAALRADGAGASGAVVQTEGMVCPDRLVNEL